MKVKEFIEKLEKHQDKELIFNDFGGDYVDMEYVTMDEGEDDLVVYLKL